MAYNNNNNNKLNKKHIQRVNRGVVILDVMLIIERNKPAKVYQRAKSTL